MICQLQEWFRGLVGTHPNIDERKGDLASTDQHQQIALSK
jgi:hypothetical protein